MRRLLCALFVLCPSLTFAEGRLPPKVERSIAAALAQGGIGPIGMLPGRVDSNNALVVTAVAAGTTGTQGSPIANLPGKVDASNNLVVTLASGSVIPAPGSTTQVIFNDAGVLGGDAGMTYTKATDLLAVAGAVHVGAAGVADMASIRLVGVQVSGTYFQNYLNQNAAATAGFAFGYDTTGPYGVMAATNSGGGLRFLNASSNGWKIENTAGAAHFVPTSTNSYDICASGTTCRTGYFGTSVVSPILQGSGTGVSVANVGANSCGTTAATIAGNQVSGKITVGATAGTQCRVTFSTAAPVSRDCTVTDETTTIATRATYVSTTTHDFLGAFVAGDLVTYICTVR